MSGKPGICSAVVKVHTLAIVTLADVTPQSCRSVPWGVYIYVALPQYSTAHDNGTIEIKSSPLPVVQALNTRTMRYILH